jgi:hypothetical protein
VASHAEGSSTRTGSIDEAFGSSVGSHAEGQYTSATGKASHAEGSGYVVDLGIKLSTEPPITIKPDNKVVMGHLDNTSDIAIGDVLILQQTDKPTRYYNVTITAIENNDITFIGEIDYNKVYNVSKAILNEAIGDYSHVSGLGTIAKGEAQTVVGKYNKEDEDALFIVGGGENADNRRNAFVVHKTRWGNIYGTLYGDQILTSNSQELENGIFFS